MEIFLFNSFLNQFTIFNYIYYNNYLYALFIFLLFFIISNVLVLIIEKILLFFGKKLNTNIDYLIVNAIKVYIIPILIFLGFYLVLTYLDLQKNIEFIIKNILISFIIIFITLLLSKILHILITFWGSNWAKRSKSQIDRQLIILFDRFFNFFIWFLALMFILQSWGVKIGPLLASLGIVGIAVAFALQNTLGNVFGGMSMIIDNTIKVGDIIELDEDTKGTILDIGVRSTKIRTWNNEVIILPNGNLSNSKITNYVKPEDKLRVVIPFSVAYGSNIKKVKNVVMKEIVKIKNYISEPEPMVRFLEMADSSLNFKAYFYVDNYISRFQAIDEANVRIYNALIKNKINIPFPQMDVYIKQHKKR